MHHRFKNHDMYCPFSFLSLPLIFSLFIQIHFPSLYFHPFSWYLFTGVFPFPSLYFSKLMQFSKFMKRLLKSHPKQYRMLSSRPAAPYLPSHHHQLIFIQNSCDLFWQFKVSLFIFGILIMTPTKMDVWDMSQASKYLT